MLEGASDWWYALSDTTRTALLRNPQVLLCDELLGDVRDAQGSGSDPWVAVTDAPCGWRLTEAAVRRVEIINALTITARGVTA